MPNKLSPTANFGQFALLVAVNGLVGGMVGLAVTAAAHSFAAWAFAAVLLGVDRP